MLTQLPVLTTVRQHVRRPAIPERKVAEWAIVSAGLAPVVLVAGWAVAGLVQPASYSPVRQTVSVMAGQAGTDRWIVTGALFLVGACNLVTAVGLTGARPPARILLVVAGLASVGIAASPEPANGSTPQHLAWTALGAVTIAVWPAFVGRGGAPPPRILSGYSSVAVTAVFVALLCWLTLETQGGGLLGLAERLTSSVQCSWPFIVALSLRSTSRARRQESPGEQLPVPRASDHDETAIQLTEVH